MRIRPSFIFIAAGLALASALLAQDRSGTHEIKGGTGIDLELVQSLARMQATRPLEVLLYASDRVVRGKVLSVGEPQKQTLILPAAQCKMWYRKYEVQVVEDVIDRDGFAGLPASAPASMPADDKAPKPLIVYMFADDPEKLAAGASGIYPTMTAGVEYLMVLQTVTLPKDAYFLPSMSDAWRKFNPLWMQRVQAAADAKNWPWGEEVKGLRLALLVRSPVVLRPGGGKGRIGEGDAFVSVLVAMKNVSAKPIWLSFYDVDEYLMFRSVSDGADAREIAHDPYRFYERKNPRPFAPPFPSPFVSAIMPGQLAFVDARARGESGMDFFMSMTKGKCKLRAQFSSQRQYKDVDRQKNKNLPELWNGLLESKPIEVDVDAPKPLPAATAPASLPAEKN